MKHCLKHCRKIAYPTLRDAMDQVRWRMLGVRGGLRPYTCGHCGSWHLTSATNRGPA